MHILFEFELKFMYLVCEILNANNIRTHMAQTFVRELYIQISHPCRIHKKIINFVQMFNIYKKS